MMDNMQGYNLITSNGIPINVQKFELTLEQVEALLSEREKQVKG